MVEYDWVRGTWMVCTLQNVNVNFCIVEAWFCLWVCSAPVLCSPPMCATSYAQVPTSSHGCNGSSTCMKAAWYSCVGPPAVASPNGLCRLPTTWGLQLASSLTIQLKLAMNP